VNFGPLYKVRGASPGDHSGMEITPRVCFLPSASDDADHYVVRFYRAFAADRCEASHISLFRREQGARRRVKGLGLLPFSNWVHYEPTSARRFAYRLDAVGQLWSRCAWRPLIWA
jgi:hypothetical protein